VVQVENDGDAAVGGDGAVRARQREQATGSLFCSDGIVSNSTMINRLCSSFHIFLSLN
jgi:hypothetical protein